MIDLLRLCRWYYAGPMALILTLTIWYALGDEIAGRWGEAWLATAALALVVAGGYVLNDVCDREVDRVNAPERPIAAGRVSPRIATLWAAGMMVGGLVAAAFCGERFFAGMFALAGGLVFYDLASKRLGIGKQLVIAVLMTSIYPLAFLFAGTATGSSVGTLYIFPVWLFLTSFGYEALKDIRDSAGDQAATSIRTWIQRDPQLALRVARAAVILGALALIGPGFTGCGWVYLGVIPIAIGLAAWSAFLPPRRAIVAIYLECVMVGIAAVMDIGTNN